jgi:methionyl-tRNA formyltransferase
MSAITIHNLVRGLTKPYIGAHIEYKDEIIKVWETKIIRGGEKNIEPGKVILVDNNGIIVKTGENAIRLIKTDPVLDIGPGSYL